MKEAASPSPHAVPGPWFYPVNVDSEKAFVASTTCGFSGPLLRGPHQWLVSANYQSSLLPSLSKKMSSVAAFFFARVAMIAFADSSGPRHASGPPMSVRIHPG